MQEMPRSWRGLRPPVRVYMKTLYTLVQDRLEAEDEREIIWDDEITRKLADFQKTRLSRSSDHSRQRRRFRCRRGRARQELHRRCDREAFRAHRARLR